MNQGINQKNIEIIKEILKDEIEGNIQAALEKMHDDYKMTWVYKRRDGILFPNAKVNKKQQLEDVYVIKGREYRINHIIAEGETVMAELTESYPDPETGQMYRTPMVIVWEFENGKIKRGRHYCDPQLSYENLSNEQIDGIYE